MAAPQDASDVDVTELMPCCGYCCAIYSCYCKWPDCLGCKGEGSFLCIQDEFAICKMLDNEENADGKCLICCEIGSYCVMPKSVSLHYGEHAQSMGRQERTRAKSTFAPALPSHCSLAPTWRQRVMTSRLTRFLPPRPPHTTTRATVFPYRFHSAAPTRARSSASTYAWPFPAPTRSPASGRACPSAPSWLTSRSRWAA